MSTGDKIDNKADELKGKEGRRPRRSSTYLAGLRSISPRRSAALSPARRVAWTRCSVPADSDLPAVPWVRTKAVATAWTWLR
jgi:hypothetical protein